MAGFPSGASMRCHVSAVLADAPAHRCPGAPFRKVHLDAFGALVAIHEGPRRGTAVVAHLSGKGLRIPQEHAVVRRRENGDVAAALCMLRTTMPRLAELEALLPQPRELTRPKDGPVTQAG
jgi:hypothetical protein